LNFHGLRRLSLPFILSSALYHSTYASFRPSFDLDYCSWHATDIVLVATMPADSVFEVVESWKGDLRAGDLVTVPELRPAASAVPIPRYPEHADFLNADANEVRTQIPKQEVGSRMVLFLKRRRLSQTSPPGASPVAHSQWQPSDPLGDMKASVIWIDSGKLYRFQQEVNPGPSILVPGDLSEATLRERVVEVDRIQQQLAAALNVQDGQARAELLKPCVRSAVFPAQRLALEELGKCGPLALATIRGMLDEPAFADEAADLIKAYVEAGGEMVGKELNVRLQRELEFWRATGPSLSEGWWNQDPTPHAPLRERYSQTLQLIRGLTHTHYDVALSTVKQLRDLWRSYPQLNDPSGLNQMAEECDRLIEHLQGN